MAEVNGGEERIRSNQMDSYMYQRRKHIAARGIYTWYIHESKKHRKRYMKYTEQIVDKNKESQ